MKAIFSVQTVDRESGKEHWVRVEARDRDDARQQVAALGEVVGECKLVEVVQSDPIPTPVSVQAIPTQTTTIPGVVTCPKCGGQTWKGGRGWAVWFLVLMLFPLGLLLLFLTPTWYCKGCGFSYSSNTAPTEIGEPPKTGVLYRMAKVLLMAIAVILGAFCTLLLIQTCSRG